MSADGRKIHREAMERIGKNIRGARRRVGFSQEKLASRCGLHRTEIGLIENGKRTPRIDTLLKISGSLGVPIEFLVRGVEWVASESPLTGTFTVFDGSLKSGGERDGENEE